MSDILRQALRYHWIENKGMPDLWFISDGRLVIRMSEVARIA